MSNGWGKIMKKPVGKIRFAFVPMAVIIILLIGVHSNLVWAGNTSVDSCERSLLNTDSLVLCYMSRGISAVDIKWLRGLAHKGNAHAEYTMGGLYFNGTGVHQNMIDALDWYRKAEKDGDKDARSQIQFTEWVLASRYTGVFPGTSRDKTKYLYWLEKAGDDGYFSAIFFLARTYEYGDSSFGIKPDYARADYWYRKLEATQSGDDSELMLGIAYANGKGVERNYEKAAFWLRKAAARGDADAEHNLGIFYMKGQGVSLNPGAAADWFYKAGIAYLKQGDRDDALQEASLIRSLQAEYGDLLPNGFLAKQLTAKIYATATNVQPNPTSQRTVSEGTGWAVAGGFIVTNHHVIARAQQIWIRTASGVESSATVIADDPNNDLVLLKVQNPKVLPPALPLAPNPAPVGESVFALGYPQPDIMGADIKLTSGLISAETGANDDPRFYQTSTQIEDGNSGSPLLDMHGRVVGIMTESLDAAKLLKLTGDMPQNVNYAIKVVYLKALLQSVQPVEEIRVLPTGSALLESLDKRIAPSVVMVFAKSSGGQ